MDLIIQELDHIMIDLAVDQIILVVHLALVDPFMIVPLVVVGSVVVPIIRDNLQGKVVPFMIAHLVQCTNDAHQDQVNHFMIDHLVHCTKDAHQVEVNPLNGDRHPEVNHWINTEVMEEDLHINGCHRDQVGPFTRESRTDLNMGPTTVRLMDAVHPSMTEHSIVPLIQGLHQSTVAQSLQ